MAVLEVPTRHYYKIDYDNSYIENGMIFCNIAVYASEDSRIKEKNRMDYINSFIAMLTSEIEKLYNTPTDTSENEILMLNKCIYIIKSNYKILIDCKNVVDIQYAVSNLSKYNFDSKILTDPVLVLPSITVNCGKYNGEERTQTMFYNAIKKIMSNTIDI